MLPRPTPQVSEDIDQLSRCQLIEGILARNEFSTFRFSERFLRRQRTKRLRDFFRDVQHRPTQEAESEIMTESA